MEGYEDLSRHADVSADMIGAGPQDADLPWSELPEEERLLRQRKMFGCTQQDLDTMMERQRDWSAPAFIAGSILSDAQELLERGESEMVRQYLNRAKYILFEYGPKDHDGRMMTLAEQRQKLAP